MTASPATRARPARAARATSWKKDPGGRRERVLGEAARLFSELGYAAVSVADVARAAGVAEGSVFHYFGSKQALLRAVGERYGTAFAAAMFAGLEPVATKATIEEVVRRAFEFVERNWPGFGLFLLSDGTGEGVPLAQRANRLAVTRAVEAVLEGWEREGALAAIDAPVVAELLFGLVEAALRSSFAGGSPISRARAEAATVSAISRILGFDGGDA